MSKINAIRLININYNHGGIRIDDETFHLKGESTLLTLRNGGGKSVLVQMLMAPFVHKRYRDLKDRKFSSYFTTNKPSFILVEWKLDGNAGYVLTGMIVRKAQGVRDDQVQDDLDMINFIHEYKGQNPYDIHKIPFIKNENDSKTLKTFSESRSLLESLKTSNEYRFSVYDMTNNMQQRNYFNKLLEFQIHYKEWESIVRKINLKESGLSELFINAKDEIGLLESWFLPTIEDKLNKDKKRIDEFRDILGQYIKQYKDNKSKIDQKNTINLFKEETSPVLDIAKDLLSQTEGKADLENKIANLIASLRKYQEDLEIERSRLEEKETILNDEIERIEYEKISFAIYGLKADKLSLEDKYSKTNDLILKTEEDKQSLSKRRNIQECAKINEQYREASLDVQVIENKLELIKDKEKDRTPEREALGYTLRNHYENELKAVTDSLLKIQEELKELEKQDENLEKEAENLRRKEIKENSRLSQINANIGNFNKIENNFNVLYKEDLRRNILGKYEEGSLEIRIKELKALIEETSLEIVKLKKLNIENDEKLKVINRTIQDKTGEHAAVSQKILGLEEKLKDLDSKIEVRKSIIKHIGFKEEQIFDTEDILSEFKRRKDEVSEDIKAIELKIRDLKDEYNRLKSGKVLELPKDIKDALDIQGINYVYGMEWLKRNNKSFKENSEIVKNNPFIPYGLILTSQDLQRLKANNLDIYTSFPIPIIIRENLEKKFDGKSSLDSSNGAVLGTMVDSSNNNSSLFESERVSFYVLFNNNLLDEEELLKILAEQEGKIQKAQTALDRRTEDFNEYDEKYNLIFFQGLSSKDYNDTKKAIETLEKTKDTFENDLARLRENEVNIKKSQDKLLDTINFNEKTLDKLERKDKDLFKLYSEYKEYLELLEDRNLVEETISKVKSDILEIKDEVIKIKNRREKGLESRIEYKDKHRNVEEKLKEYLKYDIQEDIHKEFDKLLKKDIEDIEARYISLTKEITSELKDVEEELSKAHGRFNDYERELINRSKILGVTEVEYTAEKYDIFILESIEEDIRSIESKLKELANISSDLKSEIAVKNNQIATEMKILKERLGKEELIAESEIVLTDFNKLIFEKKDELKKVKNDSKRIFTRIGYCDNNLSALAEYYSLDLIEEIEFSEDITKMDKDSLDRFRGILIRDYRNIYEIINNLKGDLSVTLDKLLRNTAFQEDFISRPLNTLYSLIDEPREFIEQLLTTIKAYDDLMAKLEIDIALVDKEKVRIIQILLEYIRDIHKNLSMIDKNSTIKIREKSIKMLRIEMPDWEQGEAEYRNRLEEIIVELTKSGINRLENNENIEEIISPIITTNNLYNSVVGIANIRIRLYKIEAQRQYSIDWADVSKNSGGEGFLSAFVILSSLLSFMRRDDTDIFAELEEGKVLIMDNPFAQTNAAHLLEPLMDVAKKSNTQLIAFTGLNGESIYNSFDNIYVLNLISSKLKREMQYLKSQHAKGKDLEVMVSSQVRTEEMEQLTLF